MSSPTTIRRATINDANRVANFNIAMAWETEQIRLNPYTIERGVKAAIEDPGKCDYWVAEAGKEVIGCLMVTHEWSDWRNGDIWWIQSVYVDPNHRRRGVFTAMYDHVTKLAKESGVVAIRLYVEHENAAAKSTYERHGMSVTHYQVMERDLRDQ
jgi:ribosomal protein S18 acetylase RimI-like enzyme